MKHIFQKIDRIKASGMALLQVADESPYARHNGKYYKVESMATPGVKCRITLLIDGLPVDFILTEVL